MCGHGERVKWSRLTLTRAITVAEEYLARVEEEEPPSEALAALGPYQNRHQTRSGPLVLVAPTTRTRRAPSRRSK